MTKPAPTQPAPETPQHPPGASLHLGGQAWANPALEAHLVPLDTLTPYPGNPRRGDQPAITSSIRDHGLYAGVVHQTTTGHILIGNHRRHALQELGATLIPSVPHDCDDITAAAIVARDNRTSDTGGYDPHDQVALLDTLAEAGINLGVIGFASEELLILHRQADAEDVFTVGTEHMLDEFREISGLDGASYQAEYARKVVVYIRDEDAINDFSQRLGITEPLTKDLNYPLGWVPDDRRKRPNAESPAPEPVT